MIDGKICPVGAGTRFTHNLNILKLIWIDEKTSLVKTCFRLTQGSIQTGFTVNDGGLLVFSNEIRLKVTFSILNDVISFHPM